MVDAQGNIVSATQLNAALDSVAQQVNAPAAQVGPNGTGQGQNQGQPGQSMDQPLVQGADGGVVTGVPTPGNPQLPQSADGVAGANPAGNATGAQNAPGQQALNPGQPVPIGSGGNQVIPGVQPGSGPGSSQPSQPNSRPGNSPISPNPQVLPNQPAVSPVSSRNPVEVTNDNMTPGNPAVQPTNAPNSPNRPNRPGQPNPSNSPAATPANQSGPQAANQLPPGVIADQPLGAARQPRTPRSNPSAQNPNSIDIALPRQQI